MNYGPIFQGSRLREARQARALSAQALSELIDVAASSISQYEHDKQVPPSHVIAKISETLNLPAHFFTAPPEQEFRRFLRWRSQSSASKLLRERAEKKYEWFRRIVWFLEQHIQLPPPRFPDFGFGDNPSLITQDDIEQAAQRLRRAWGLGDGPISDVVRLVENNGGVVVRGPMYDSGLDAFSDFGSNARCYIALSTDKDCAVRSRQDIGHEIAHAFLHRHVPERVSKQPAIHAEMERQAHRFSTAFLMPGATFPKEVCGYSSIDALLYLKPRWKTSVAAMVMRLTDLRVIDEKRRGLLFSQLSRRGWRKKEPLDDKLPPEQPLLLLRAVDAVLASKGASVIDEMVQKTHLPIAEIERSLGLPCNHLIGVDPPPTFHLRLTRVDNDHKQQ